MIHGRGQIQYVDLGLKRDGTIVARAGPDRRRCRRVPVDRRVPAVPHPDDGDRASTTIPKVEVTGVSVATNTTPTAAYRGAGRPEAAAFLERIVDMAARRARHGPGRDPQARTSSRRSAFPLSTVTGANYDVGEYAKALDEACRRRRLRRPAAPSRQARRERGDTKLLGIGVSAYVEVTARRALPGVRRGRDRAPTAP